MTDTMCQSAAVTATPHGSVLLVQIDAASLYSDEHSHNSNSAHASDYSSVTDTSNAVAETTRAERLTDMAAMIVCGTRAVATRVQTTVSQVEQHGTLTPRCMHSA